jgi:cytochrome bd-type quinol oxidase subunit 2
MELLTPGIGLIVWQLVMLTALVLLLLSWILIFKDTKISRTKKVVWLLVTSMLPVVGPVVFLVSAKKLSSE